MIQEFDINVVASLLKQYLRELPEPLLTDALYRNLVQGMSLSDPEAKQKYLIAQIHTLSPVNLGTLFFLLDHMLRSVHTPPSAPPPSRSQGTIFFLLIKTSLFL